MSSLRASAPALAAPSSSSPSSSSSSTAAAVSAALVAPEEYTCSPDLWNPNESMDEEELEPWWRRERAHPPPDPLPAVEFQRHLAVGNLRDRLTRLVHAAGVSAGLVEAGDGSSVVPNKQLFEEWLMRQMLQQTLRLRKTVAKEGGYPAMWDPMIPYKPADDAVLAKELLDAGLLQEDVDRIVRAMSAAATKAVKTLSRKRQEEARVGVGVAATSSRATAVPSEDGLSVALAFRNIRLHVNQAHFDKLRVLYSRFAPPPRQRLSAEADFVNRAFCMVLRYDTLQGTYTQGAGFQAAMMGGCFDVLLELGVRFEGFASPLNCRYARYCSAFFDTDRVFGSVGSFWNFEPTHGCFELNPPFEATLINMMALHMERCLERTVQPLCFVIIVPEWKETRGWQRLAQGMSQKLVIKQKEHGYMEGAQHQRTSRFRISTCNTSVFWWANEAGFAEHCGSAQLLKRLRLAFRSRHNEHQDESHGKKKRRKGDVSSNSSSNSGGVGGGEGSEETSAKKMRLDTTKRKKTKKKKKKKQKKMD